MPDTFLRRSIVVALALFALVAGGMAIRVAASWTAEAATLTSRPATAEQLIAELDAERALAQGLRARVTTMAGLVDDLRGAAGLTRGSASGGRHHRGTAARRGGSFRGGRRRGP
jgi:hypothetical protein